jgi:hypothetical protein
VRVELDRDALLGWYVWRSVLADGAPRWCATGPWLDDPVFVAGSPVDLLELFALLPPRQGRLLPVPLLEQLV